MGRKAAFFGGTFDPVHIGHLITARAVAEELGFEHITLVPAASPPHKDGAVASGKHRLAMLRLAARDDPLFGISQVELHRDGPSYTFDTLEALRDQYGPDAQLTWIIGADMLEGLSSWHRADELLSLARLAIACRPPWQQRIPQLLEGLADDLPGSSIESLAASVVQTPLLEVSSCRIRRRIAEGLTVRHLTPDSVVAYIETHRLYR